MKFVVLLALVGLASCRTTLKGGDRARDVTIEYTYINDQGKEVTVEVKADELGLDLSQDDSKLTLKKPTSSASIERPRFVQVERQPEPAAPRFMRVLPQPAPAPASLFETEFRTVSAKPAAPRIAPGFRFVELDDFETPEARFVQVEAPRRQTQFVEVEIPKPVGRTQFVQFEAPRQKVKPRFVQVEAPRTKVETRFVEVEVPEPEFETRFVQVQSPRREARTHFVQAKTAAAAGPRSVSAPTHFMQVAKPAFTPSSFQVPHPAFTAQAVSSSQNRRVSPVRRHQFSSDDDSSEK